MTRALSTAVTVLDSPFGPVHLAVTDDAVVGLELRTTFEAFVDDLVERGAVRIEDTRSDWTVAQRRLIDRAARQLDAYFAGQAVAFDLPVEPRGRSSWDRRVLEGVRRVPFGRVTSYGRLATAIGSRGAARAVGGAVARSPIGLIVPCHRVIAGDGSLGGYGVGRSADHDEHLELKRSLLLHEGVLLPVQDEGWFHDRPRA